MVPVVILTGFLGSGKTSLLNRLLSTRPSSHPGKLAIIVNEFGDVGIDGDLLPADMTQQVELPGGCICCQLSDDLEKTLTDLLESQPELSMIIIETTGVAEPVPITWSILRAPLDARLRVAAVVTVVDPLHHAAHRPLSHAVDLQVSDADLIAITKLDLVPGNRVPAELAAHLQHANPLAPVLAAQPDALPHRVWAALADPELRSTRPGPPGGAPGEPSHRGHAEEFTCVWLPIESTLDFEELATQLEELPASYVRIKGIARVIDGSTGSEEPHIIAFHRVGTRVSSEPLPNHPTPRIVALGPGIEPGPLAACLDAAVVR